jgi:hypothetical protein
VHDFKDRFFDQTAMRMKDIGSLDGAATDHEAHHLMGESSSMIFHVVVRDVEEEMLGVEHQPVHIEYDGIKSQFWVHFDPPFPI